MSGAGPNDRRGPRTGRGAKQPGRGGTEHRDRGRGPADREGSTGAIWIGGRRAVAEAIRAGRARDVRVTGASSVLAGIIADAESRGVPVSTLPAEELDEMAFDHQGVVARVVLPRELGDTDLREFAFGPDAVVVVLDGITDPQNLGAAARSAEAAGVALLVSRVRRGAPVTPAAVRASAGALLHLPFARVTNLTRTLRLLQERGFTAVGLDEDARDSIFDGPAPDGQLALVVGAEGSGISRLVRETCDLLVSLPMKGKVQSLNASASLAAALFAYVLPRVNA